MLFIQLNKYEISSLHLNRTDLLELAQKSICNDGTQNRRQIAKRTERIEEDQRLVVAVLEDIEQVKSENCTHSIVAKKRQKLRHI